MRLALLAVGGATVAATAAATTKPKSDVKSKTEPAIPSTKKPTTGAKATTTTTTRQSKALKAVPGENRGKRTLYDFGNAGYLYPEVASRRAGYVDNYYTQSGYYNGQQAIAQYPGSFGGGYAPYPQYLEAPEPIIEIIIKDANETLAEEPVQPTVTKKQKKKKEKVHVFYVNYKKDQNNKLHLESPIASLNNDDNDEPEEEEEEEEIVQYPVTPLPPLKSTTLRTIIHPDSEKYHSNSGIHVSFGAENKHQTGHILEEHDAESIQRQVVALPLTNTRADYGRESSFARGHASNLLYSSSNAYQSAQQQQAPQQLHFSHQQQLPAQHSSNYFRLPASKPPQQSQPQQQHQQLQYYQKPQQQPQQQQQQQHVARPSITQQQLPSTSSQTIFNKLVQQSQFYVNHNQQYATQPQQQQQQYQKPPHKQVQVPFFPTIPPKSPELPSRPSLAPYQPIKFRPTPAPTAQTKPLQLPLQHQQQQQYQSATQSHSKPQPYQFIRQPQFVQQPQFIVHSPTPATDYYAQQQHQQSQQSQQQHKYSSPALSYFDIKPSKETELLKSIPKYEQHITETVQNQPSQQQHQLSLQQFAYSNTRNEVIHDVPAPNLAPAAVSVAQPQAQPITGHYITASSAHISQQQQQQQQQQQSHYNNYPSESPPVYAESTHGQKVMVVTPVPPSASYATYQQYPQGNTEHVIQVHPQAQQPRQSPAGAQFNAAAPGDNSPFSVSTYHSDVFKELQQRQQQEKPQQQQQQQQQPPTNYVTPIKPAAAAVSASAPSSPAPLPTAAPKPNGKASQTLLQLPDEVPDDLRQQLLSSGILNNADISILDYDKQGDIALENLPAEHLQHFYGAGGGAQIAETNKVLTVVKPNGDKVALSEKQIDRVKQSNSLPQKQNLDVKVVRYDAAQGQSVSEKYVRTDATVVTPVELADRQQYNRYLPLKINGAQFPIPDTEELLGKKIVSVVVLAPVEAQTQSQSIEARSSVDSREVKFLGGELVKTLVKKPTKDNFKRWLEKEARTDIELQSVVLLVTKSSDTAEQEIFMYDIATGNVNKLNGELSSTFVNVAEENASSEDLEHAATLDPSSLESMMHLRRR
ncbi:putative mediator of RNA polymerase II transcription subunit 26 [Drosophila innubila]|uniref:putative mediator of RNA polymerase II transcription subunit 26 n=1 Tax=Drosophila innubila TaxID=198719 RepID=UPI00148B3C26|nr:putative mediator of RNA polymerase II transcription subunit 26 [Drosophila innubila]